MPSSSDINLSAVFTLFAGSEFVPVIVFAESASSNATRGVAVENVHKAQINLELSLRSSRKTKIVNKAPTYLQISKLPALS